MNYFHSLVSQSLQRSRESTMGLLGIRHPGLREHLRSLLADEPSAEEGLLGSPVFEHTFGWKQEDAPLGDLVPYLLSAELLAALATPGPYQFLPDSKPYCHQLVAWRSLLEPQPRSLVITSGTGSGKTECFMVPILEDLVRDRAKNGRLVGVRALFLYPLNALINSQRERLDAWTKRFQGDIRFCLYNGNTPDRTSSVRNEQRQRQNEIMSRELLREQPAPILMTNSTMLEYMMIRQIDSPIIEISRKSGSLRWIVLDEAHTYVGSQAAEMSLLLRRVVQAFGKRSEEIRFIATSATIADGDATVKLKQYLAGLAGVPEHQVVIVGGSRSVPPLQAATDTESGPLEEVLAIDAGNEVSSARYAALTRHTISRRIRDFIVGRGTPASLDEIVSDVSDKLTEATARERKFEVLSWIDVMTETADAVDGDYFLKVRGHFFQRALNGLWSCADQGCGAKSSALADWPFGNVYAAQRGACECGAPVCELVFCNDCKGPHLVAEDAAGRLRQVSPDAGDEFAVIEETAAEGDETTTDEDAEGSIGSRSLLCLAPAGHGASDYVVQRVGLSNHRIGHADDEGSFRVSLCQKSDANCSECGTASSHGREFFRGVHLGAPFYLTGIVPTVLEYCPDPAKSELNGRSPEELPGRGRRVITFTDSRQGTARLAVRMQQEAERSRLRGLVFEVVRNEQARFAARLAQSEKSPEELEALAKSLREVGMSEQALMLEQQAAALRGGVAASLRKEVPWRTLAEQLAGSSDLTSITEYNRHANPLLFNGNAGSIVMAELLLAREFYRRPKNQNSSETLGLLRVGYQGLSEIQTTPAHWAGRVVRDGVGGERGLSAEDWRSFLKVGLDFHVRENSYISVLPAMREWMGSRFAPKKLLAPTADAIESSTVKKWPSVRPGQASRLIKVLEAATGLDRKRRDHSDIIDSWLEAAWIALISAKILVPYENGYSLDRDTLTFSLPTQAWLCPVTRRLIDTTLRGVTLYLPPKFDIDAYRCSLVALPNTVRFAPDGSSEPIVAQIRRVVNLDAAVHGLRQVGLWSDISDRTVEGGYYYRTAEHSAQQNADRLKKYEQMFKEGRINALNCSTTMEMGVDIGGVSAVVMNNVPPHPANYLQRAGRAGRRRESRAIAYTLCKANPREMRVFRSPVWPFVTRIAAPTVILSSDRIVARHVHSMLLARFLIGLGTDGDRTKLNLRWFFGGESQRVDAAFIAFLSEPPAEIPEKVRELTRGTVLAGRSVTAICDSAAEHVSRIGDAWRAERAKLATLIAGTDEGPYQRALERELQRLEDEYLLRDLCARAFLPGYGFPTDVVTLNTSNVVEFRARTAAREAGVREDNGFASRQMPSRSLDVAIREYAPGAQLVIDGRVHRSAGVSLQWHAGGVVNESQRFDISWRCRNCGSAGLVENAYANRDSTICVTCGAASTELELDTILRPAGFLTDFFAAPSNDVSSQTYVPVQDPRVSVRGEAVAFPDASCGHFVFGHEGQVFHHSRGEHGCGYAICMACGRADSMTASNEVPSSLKPGTVHRPLQGGVGKEAASCSAEAVKKNVHLGYQFLTDVLEIFLKSPRTGEWLGIGTDAKLAGATLGLALREVIASRLGIASTEIDFATRQDKDQATGRARTVIQLFDCVSGGAGFVLAGVSELAQLMSEARARLDCPASCETVCTQCLAGNDNQVERRALDRHRAIAWFDQADVIAHLRLSSDFDGISGAKYCSLDPRRFVASRVVEGVQELRFFLAGEPEDWDLASAGFRARLLKWHVVDGLSVELSVPVGAKLDEDARRSLSGLAEMGVRISNHHRATSGPSPVFQAVGGSGISTLYCDRDNLSVPGEEWLSGDPLSRLVSTEQVPLLPTTIVDTSAWSMAPAGVTKLKVKHELDGALAEFGKRFLRLLAKEAPDVYSQIRRDDLESVAYSDRYLRSPWTLMLLAETLRALAQGAAVPLTVEAMQGSPRGRGRVENDWSIAEVQTATIQSWLKQLGFASVQVRLASNKQDMPHHRSLVMKYHSGAELIFNFDQGMGYWSPRLDRHYNVFNEEANVSKRESQMKLTREKARVSGSGISFTPIYVELISP